MNTKPPYGRGSSDPRLPMNKKAQDLANIILKADMPQKLALAIEAILADPDGCPMCDSGKLRNPGKPHWPECGFDQAAKALAEFKTLQRL
jgi:hypothetical protein